MENFSLNIMKSSEGSPVIQVHGTQIVARRGEQQKTRDSQYWNKVDTVPRRDFTAIRQRGFRRDDDYLLDIGPPAAGQASQPQAVPGSTPPAPLLHHGAPSTKGAVELPGSSHIGSTSTAQASDQVCISQETGRQGKGQGRRQGGEAI